MPHSLAVWHSHVTKCLRWSHKRKRCERFPDGGLKGNETAFLFPFLLSQDLVIGIRATYTSDGSWVLRVAVCWDERSLVSTTTTEPPPSPRSWCKRNKLLACLVHSHPSFCCSSQTYILVHIPPGSVAQLVEPASELDLSSNPGSITKMALAFFWWLLFIFFDNHLRSS